MPRQLQKNIRTERQGVFSGVGALTLFVGPPVGPSWELRQIAISTTSVLETTCVTYIGINSSGVLVSQSFTGNNDTDSRPNVTLRPGDNIAAVWAGGTPGATGKLTLIYDEVAY